MNEFPQPGIYEHFKGNKYEVFGVIKNSENEPAPGYEYFVLYRPVDQDKGDIQNKMFIRPLYDFTSLVEWPDGKLQPRFKPFTLFHSATGFIRLPKFFKSWQKEEK